MHLSVYKKADPWSWLKNNDYLQTILFSRRAMLSTLLFSTNYLCYIPLMLHTELAIQEMETQFCASIPKKPTFRIDKYSRLGIFDIFRRFQNPAACSRRQRLPRKSSNSLRIICSAQDIQNQGQRICIYCISMCVSVT